MSASNLSTQIQPSKTTKTKGKEPVTNMEVVKSKSSGNTRMAATQAEKQNDRKAEQELFRGEFTEFLR